MKSIFIYIGNKIDSIFDPVSYQMMSLSDTSDDSLIDLTTNTPVLNSLQTAILSLGGGGNYNNNNNSAEEQQLAEIGVNFLSPNTCHLPPSGNVFCVAAHSYTKRLSVDELVFQRGDILKPLGQLERGWWFGKIFISSVSKKGAFGVFPSNYVRCFSMEDH